MDILRLNRNIAWASIGLNGFSALLNAALGNLGWVIANGAAAAVSALVLTLIWRSNG